MQCNFPFTKIIIMDLILFGDKTSLVTYDWSLSDISPLTPWSFDRNRNVPMNNSTRIWLALVSWRTGIICTYITFCLDILFWYRLQFSGMEKKNICLVQMLIYMKMKLTYFFCYCFVILQLIKSLRTVLQGNWMEMESISRDFKENVGIYIFTQ